MARRRLKDWVASISLLLAKKVLNMLFKPSCTCIISCACAHAQAASGTQAPHPKEHTHVCVSRSCRQRACQEARALAAAAFQPQAGQCSARCARPGLCAITCILVEVSNGPWTRPDSACSALDLWSSFHVQL